MSTFVRIACLFCLAAGCTLASVDDVLVSDSFHRADAGTCSLGVADGFAGGNGTHRKQPIFGQASGPIGANIVNGALQNNSKDFGGMQLTSDMNPCSNTASGEFIPSDISIRVDVLVPATDAGVVDAGPYSRSRSATAGDGIAGGTSKGYWVQLTSSGEVRVMQLNPFLQLANSGIPPVFDTTIFHPGKSRCP